MTYSFSLFCIPPFLQDAQDGVHSLVPPFVSCTIPVSYVRLRDGNWPKVTWGLTCSSNTAMMVRTAAMCLLRFYRILGAIETICAIEAVI